ncbi:MAG: glycosyltransferase [Desulfovibrio sp.]|nr:glycosyltransferase [Desulfovibrio sp.]
MGGQPKVSVLVPVYNVERYLSKCLDSLVRQTLDDLEIIVIDDGSTDASGAIADRYAEKNANMVVVHKPNEGYGKTLNLGISLAKGEYIGILESDDWCSPFMFERLYTQAKEKDVEVIKSDFYKWWSETDISVNQSVAPHEVYNTKTNLRKNIELIFMQPSIWSSIYKRDFLVKNGIFLTETPGASYQDASFQHKVLFCVESLFVINESFIYYRQDNPTSSVYDKRKIFCVCDEYDECRSFLQEKGLPFTSLLERARVGGYLWNYNRLDEEGRRMFYPRMRGDFARIKKEGFLTRDLYPQSAIVKILSIINGLGKYSQQRIECGEVFGEPIRLW